MPKHRHCATGGGWRSFGGREGGGGYGGGKGVEGDGGGAGDGEWITVKTPIAAFNPPTDSGITVKYRLLRTATPDNATSWVAVGELKDTPSFPVNIAGQEGDTFWKIEVVFQGEAANE